MITSISPVGNRISTFHAVEGANQTLLQKVWNAVIEFFTMIAGKIKDAIARVKSCLPAFKKPPVTAVNTPLANGNVDGVPQTLSKKLDPYKNMPAGDIPFLKRAIENLRPQLQRKDAKLAEALRAKGIDPDLLEGLQIPDGQKPNQLANFNEELENFQGEVMPKLVIAAIRAVLFCENNYRCATDLPRFLQGRFEKVADDPLPNGNTPVVNRYVQYGDKIIILRKEFQALPNQEKEIILDEFDSDIDQLQLSPHGKKIVREIGAYSNALIQHNTFFDRAVQGLA